MFDREGPRLWPSEPPAKHSSRQIEEMIERMRYCLLLLATDRLLMMVRRQVADLWRRAAENARSIRSV